MFLEDKLLKILRETDSQNPVRVKKAKEYLLFSCLKNFTDACGEDEEERLKVLTPQFTRVENTFKRALSIAKKEGISFIEEGAFRDFMLSDKTISEYIAQL